MLFVVIVNQKVGGGGQTNLSVCFRRLEAEDPDLAGVP